MTEVLVDTSALIAFFVGSEKHHLAVKNYFLAYPDAKWVVLSTIFDETVTWLRVKVSRTRSLLVGCCVKSIAMLLYRMQMIMRHGKHFVDTMISRGAIRIVRFW
jgi:predicted nucleic acid-binding protein